MWRRFRWKVYLRPERVHPLMSLLMMSNSLQAAQEVTADIVEVFAALAQVGVLDTGQLIGELFGRLENCPLGVDPLVADPGRDSASKGLIAK